MEILQLIHSRIFKPLSIFALAVVLGACQIDLSSDLGKPTCDGSKDLNELTKEKIITGFSKTKFLLADAKNPATVLDDFNKIYLICANQPESITVKNGVRIVTFKQFLHVKSDKDSISLNPTGGNLGGYMGAPLDKNSREFKVYANGEINSEQITTVETKTEKINSDGTTTVETITEKITSPSH